jgi:enoyl-CoA hydratase/carnithine racemase
MTASGHETLVVDFRDAILWLRINRPKRRNALSRATLAELGQACADGGALPDMKAAVLIGEGGDAFAAGGDLKEFASLRTAEDAAQLFDLASSTLDRIRQFPVPVVAALNGCALGGGAELALACDFRVAAPHAVIGYIQANLNISSGFGGGADLMRLLGSSAGMLHGLSAEALDMPRARTLGLIDTVAAAGEPIEHCVRRFLDPILRQQPQVIRAYKAMAICEREGLGHEARRTIEREWFKRTWAHEDHWSAVDRMFKKRPVAAS